MDLRLTLEIVPVVVLLTTTILKSGLPEKCYDGRTIRNRWLRRSLNSLAVLSAVAAVLVVYFQDKSERSKNFKLTEIHEQNDSIMRLYGPIAELAQNRFPDSSVTAAIATLSTEMKSEISNTKREIIDFTQEIYNRDEYRPLDAVVRSDLVQRLTSTLREGGVPFRNVIVFCQEGDPNRALYVADIVDAIRSVGLTVSTSSGLMIGGRGGEPVTCGYRSVNHDAAVRFVQALGPVLNSRVGDIAVPDMDSSTVELTIFGKPTYPPDGSIRLK